ncbi:hypothetical protein SEUCBS139899_000150 [Sporothrix eucalyptigena]|uniref:Uncharacterized protein n=1 Tax=Sporothrix eucalyptigena TaxID=1812306 RepID=A0ABP0C0Y1_9PEZI
MLSQTRAVHRPLQPQLRQALECATRASKATNGDATRIAVPASVMAFHTARERARIAQATKSAAESLRYTQSVFSTPTQCSRRAFSVTISQRQPETTSTTSSAARTAAQAAASLPDLDKVAALVNGARDRLLSHPGIPSEEETATALRICAEAADLIMDAAVQPQLSHIDHQADTAASALLSLDAKQRAAALPAQTDAVQPPLRHVIDQISDAAYAIADEPRVFLTPALLEQYVQIQARLGRPESLPHVLDLYASKPAPKMEGSEIKYVPQNARRPASAVATTVAELALDVALTAKNLDAAVGVVEHTFAAPAFIRAKLLKKGFLPAFVVVGVPMATYILASQLAEAQTNMDTTTATSLAFAAILAYIGFTGTIGVVANTTANDQMKRVTWAPGTPLRERWLREEERAALDSVACAFGFREAHRYGEEEGAEFQALREYIMRKGMLLDQIELMEGMSS